MKKALYSLAFAVATAIGILPLILAQSKLGAGFIDLNTAVALNLLGWALVVVLISVRQDLHRSAVRTANSLGIETGLKSLENLVRDLLREVERKNSSLALSSVEGRINSREELSRTLERVVGVAFKLLAADSAELALFDREAGTYHSSFVLGKPFRSGAQAMLSDAVGDTVTELSPEVMVQPIAFAGSVLGSLRVGLHKGSIPSTGDREIMRLLALQGGLAIINAQYTHELVRMKRQSDESVRAKTGFLANLSHEIRGPLGIMLNAVELVLDGLCGPVSQDQLETLRMVRSNGEHLLELINDVLDYAKIEAGKISPNKSEILVQDLLQDITAVARSQAEAKRHRLVFRNTQDVLSISCDRRHLRQMMLNLLTNAIKYTPEGGQIEVWADRLPSGKVRINVKDNGVGIEASDRERVFAAFERIENSYSIKQVGAGLGMSLTYRLVELNNGSIDFESAPGKGSHFWIAFPSIEYSPTMLPTHTEEVRVAQGQGEIILLVEPDEGERGMLARYLQHLGFQIVATGSRADTVEALRNRRVHLAIVDNALVDNPEDDILAVLKNSGQSTRLPIILLSSRAFVFDIEKYLRAGIDRCMTKPIALKELGLACRDLIDSQLSTSASPGTHRNPGDMVH